MFYPFYGQLWINNYQVEEDTKGVDKFLLDTARKNI